MKRKADWELFSAALIMRHMGQMVWIQISIGAHVCVVTS